jgi:hypothetical protein
MRTWPTPTHLERCGSASIEPARRGFEPHQSGAAYLALCCHTYAAMRNRGNKQKAYVQASFLLSRRDDHHERDWAGPGTRGHQARRTRRVVADDELRPLSCRRPHWRQPAPGGPALPNALSQIQDRRPCRGSGGGPFHRPSGHAGVRLRGRGRWRDHRLPSIHSAAVASVLSQAASSGIAASPCPHALRSLGATLDPRQLLAASSCHL